MMSEEKKDINLIDQLRSDLTSYISQRDNFQSNLNQAMGAIFATEQMIKKLEDKDKKKEIIQDIE
jgi:hypothetical protein